jgi:hypothetical protein
MPRHGALPRGASGSMAVERAMPRAESGANLLSTISPDNVDDDQVSVGVLVATRFDVCVLKHSTHFSCNSKN